MSNLLNNVSWKVGRCPKCSCLAVTSLDDFWGCLKCRELTHLTPSDRSDGACVFCGKPLIFLMEACLTCGNQPRQTFSCTKSYVPERVERKGYQRRL